MKLQTSEKELEQYITIRGEKIVNKTRFYLSGVFSLGTLMSFINLGFAPLIIFYIFGILFFIGNALYSSYLINKNNLKLWNIYYNAFADIVVLFFLRIYGVLIFPIPGQVDVSAKEKSLYLIYYIFIVMLPLRNNVKFSIIIGGVIVIAQIILQFIYANNGMNFKFGSDFSRGEIGISSEITADLYMIACVIISCTITNIFKTYLSESRDNERLAQDSLTKTNTILSQIKDLKLQINSAKSFAQKFREEFKIGIESQISLSSKSTNFMKEISDASKKITTSTDGQKNQILQAEDQSKKLEIQFAQLKNLIESIKNSLHLINLDMNKSRVVLNSTEETMKVINLSALKIAGTIKDMNEISSRTNLLALNASIEAARAGEYGKGFSIVAEEVSKLASKSTSHNKEIGEIIKESLSKTASGTESVSSVTNVFKNIFSGFGSMDKGLEEALKALLEFEKEKDSILKSIHKLSEEANFVSESTMLQEKSIHLTNENIRDLTNTASTFTNWLEELDTLYELLDKTENLISGI